MPTQGSERSAGLGWAMKQVSERVSAIVRLEMELAALELKRKLGALAAGIGFGVGALVLLLFALGFGLAALAAGLATAMPAWAALLVVFGALVLLAGALGLLAISALKNAAPVPEQAIEEAKLTAHAVRRNGNEDA